jgi:hypothetical protein
LPAIALGDACEPALRSAWIDLSARSQALPHSDIRWLDVLGKAYGSRSIVLIARDVSGNAVGGLAGYIATELRGAPTFHSLRGGFVAHDVIVAQALAEYARRHLAQLGCREAWVGGNAVPVFGDFRPRDRTTFSLDLSGGADILWRGFRDKVRNTIRKGEREGLVAVRDPALLPAFHAIYARAMAEKQVNVRSLDFFRALFSTFGDAARLHTALDGGRPCGAMVVVAHASGAAYPFGAFDARGRVLAANSFLLWDVVRVLAGEGVPRIDLGPSSPGSGAFKFKSNLGARPQTLYYRDLMSPGHAADRTLLQARPAAAGRGRLDHFIAKLPFALQVRARTWLGRRGRLL